MSDPRNGQRVHEGAAQTAINTYRRDGRVVTLVGTFHMAEPDYYQTLRKRVDELEAGGAVVQYEGVNNDASSPSVTDVERKAVEALRESTEARYEPVHMLDFGWVAQRDSVLYTDGPAFWRPVDVPALDVVRLFGPRRLLDQPAITAPAMQIQVIKAMDTSSVEYAKFRAMARTKFIEMADMRIDDSTTEAVIYAWREFHAVLAILGAGQDVVAIWGAPHLRGLDQVLVRNEFELADSEWVTAIAGSVDT